MSKYNFYYDESEHSRKINYKTVSAPNYYAKQPFRYHQASGQQQT